MECQNNHTVGSRFPMIWRIFLKFTLWLWLYCSFRRIWWLCCFLIRRLILLLITIQSKLIYKWWMFNGVVTRAIQILPNLSYFNPLPRPGPHLPLNIELILGAHSSTTMNQNYDPCFKATFLWSLVSLLQPGNARVKYPTKLIRLFNKLPLPDSETSVSGMRFW